MTSHEAGVSQATDALPGNHCQRHDGQQQQQQLTDYLSVCPSVWIVWRFSLVSGQPVSSVSSAANHILHTDSLDIHCTALDSLKLSLSLETTLV